MNKTLMLAMVVGGAGALAQPGTLERAHIGPDGVTPAPGWPGPAISELYSNVDTGPKSYVFFGPDIFGAMEPIFLSRLDRATQGQADVSARVSQVEFWVVASDPSSIVDFVDATITIDFYEEIADWAPPPEPVNRGWLGGFYVDTLRMPNGAVHGYVVSLADEVPLSRGRCCVDLRCWEYNGGKPPVKRSSGALPAFDGFVLPDDDPINYSPGEYPAVGYSADSFYADINGDGVYARNERFSLGGPPYIANLMIALRTRDSCEIDYNGDGYINGDDIDRIMDLVDRGCDE